MPGKETDEVKIIFQYDEFKWAHLTNDERKYGADGKRIVAPKMTLPSSSGDGPWRQKTN